MNQEQYRQKTTNSLSYVLLSKHSESLANIAKSCLYTGNLQLCALPEQLFLFQLQLEHDSIQLHVKVVCSFQLPLIVLSDVQGMPVWSTKNTELRERSGFMLYRFLNKASCSVCHSQWFEVKCSFLDKLVVSELFPALGTGTRGQKKLRDLRAHSQKVVT